MSNATAESPPDSKAAEGPKGGEPFKRQKLAGDPTNINASFAHYPPEIREDGIWLWFFVKTKCNGEHAILAKIARALGLKDRGGKEPSDQYWYQVSGGHYFKSGGDVSSFKRYMNAIRAYARTQQEQGSIPFVETKNWKLVRDYIDARRSYSTSFRFGAIEGATGAQKTHCGKHYATLNNHLETVHVESPARATRARLVEKLAELYLAPQSRSVGGKEVWIERFLKGGISIMPDTPTPTRPRCIIIDNVQRLFRPKMAPDQQPIFNYFHELQDDTGFCLILTWVPSFRQTITANDPFWAQFLGRIGGEDEILRLDQGLPKADLLKFAREFAVEDDAAALPYLKRWSGSYLGIRPLIKKLERARQLATARNSKEIEVAHLQTIDLEATPEVESEVET